MEFFACKRVLFRFKASHYLYIRINLPGHQDFRIFLERDIVRNDEAGGSNPRWRRPNKTKPPP